MHFIKRFKIMSHWSSHTQDVSKRLVFVQINNSRGMGRDMFETIRKPQSDIFDWVYVVRWILPFAKQN